ncbi:DUF2238 domain-containing protein [Nonomuraea angiospora]|uniref:DUF2238 domain-containing protein n=1 Tax=Nonomuraea angiospora TaxID=46172 RepID=UPI003F5411FF
MTPASAARRLPLVLAAVVLLALVVSGLRPYDRLTWLLETFWVIAGLPLLVVLWRRFPLTTLLCCLLAVHALVLIVGGHYTYARVPFGHWLQDVLALSRNPYDRVGHLVQGFVPAILVREVLVRTSPLRGSAWLAPLTVCVCLAFSAFFELLEWWSALAAGAAGRLPRRPGRPVGHPVGHGLRPHRRRRVPPAPHPPARPAARPPVPGLRSPEGRDPPAHRGNQSF